MQYKLKNIIICIADDSLPIECVTQKDNVFEIKLKNLKQLCMNGIATMIPSAKESVVSITITETVINDKVSNCGIKVSYTESAILHTTVFDVKNKVSSIAEECNFRNHIRYNILQTNRIELRYNKESDRLRFEIDDMFFIEKRLM